MSVNACAELVRKGDPDRFLSAMTGTPEERARLFPLYAFNLEIARAPFMSQEPMVGLVRLQFWRDVIGGKSTPSHDVVAPLQGAIQNGILSPSILLEMVDAREADTDGIGRTDVESVVRYAKETSGNMMLASVGENANTQAYIAVGTASGIANWLLSQNDLARAGRGHVPLKSQEYSELAKLGLSQMKDARAVLPQKGSAALRSAFRAHPVLKRAATHPETVLTGEVAGSEFSRRGRIMLLGATNRW